MMRAGSLFFGMLLLSGCSGPGNTGRSGPPPELVAAVPWTNGAMPQRNGEFLVIPINPVYPPISANRPDPGSRPVDCSGLDDIELSPYWVERFEPALPPLRPPGDGSIVSKGSL